MNKSESKYFNTAIKMDEAFLKLLNNTNFDYITVKDICQEAGVNRSTFYLHYETINDLLEESMDYINTKYHSYFSNMKNKIDIQQIQSLPIEDLYLITPNYLIPWLTFIKENKKLFFTFLKKKKTFKLDSAYNDMLKGLVIPILNRYNVKQEEQEYIFLFYVEGIMGIIKKWIRDDCTYSIENIASLIINCIKNPTNSV